MEKEELSRRIIVMLPVLHRIAWSQLKQAADRTQYITNRQAPGDAAAIVLLVEGGYSCTSQLQ